LDKICHVLRTKSHFPTSIFPNRIKETNFPEQEIYQIFMVPNAVLDRLCTSMQFMNTNWQTDWQIEDGPVSPARFRPMKEQKLKLSLEIRNRGDVIVVHCQGRIVYREEAAALSNLVGEVLDQTSKLVLDLSGVSSIDSAGMGELVLLHGWAQEKNVVLVCAGANSLVRTLLELTNLDTVLELHGSVESAIDALREEQVAADC
jgi:anti-anti-sigma factor